MAALVLGHAVLGAMALGAAFLPLPLRTRLVQGVTVMGAVLAVWFGFAAVDASWRAAFPVSARTAAAAAGTATAWLVAAGSAAIGAWVAPALVGVAGTGLVLASLTGWSAALVLPWLASSVVLWVLSDDAPRHGRVRAAVAASDALLVGVLLWDLATAGGWTWPPHSTAAAGVLTAAAVLRSGAVGLVWHAGASRAAPIVPVLVASAFVILPAEPPGGLWVAVGLLAVTTVFCARVLLSHDLVAGTVGAAVTGLGMAAAVAVPSERPGIAVASVVAAGAIALWRATPGAAGSERGLTIALAGLTAAVVAGPALAEGGSVVVDTEPLATAAFVASLVLLGTATSAILVIAGSVARSAAPRFTTEAAAAATRVACVVALVAFVVVTWRSGVGGRPGGGLVVTAIAAGASLGVISADGAVRGWRPALRAERPPRGEAALARVALILELSAGAGAVWFTVAGLRVGFL